MASQKGIWDSSPLSLEEKLFYGVRKNPTPRNERNYPTWDPKKFIRQKALASASNRQLLGGDQ